MLSKRLLIHSNHICWLVLQVQTMAPRRALHEVSSLPPVSCVHAPPAELNFACVEMATGKEGNATGESQRTHYAAHPSYAAPISLTSFIACTRRAWWVGKDRRLSLICLVSVPLARTGKVCSSSRWSCGSVADRANNLTRIFSFFREVDIR